MPGKHRNWHRAWTLDAPGRTARHDTGLVVRYRPMPAGDVACEITPDSLAAWIASDPLRVSDLEPRLRRLMREARELWDYHHDR